MVYKPQQKSIFEPFFLGIFSGSSERIISVPVQRAHMVKDYSEEVYVFPDDFIGNAKLLSRWKPEFDYDLLSDHGIENAFEGNKYSTLRKGRLYACAGSDHDKKDRLLSLLPFFSRNRSDIDKDISVFEKKYLVSQFIMHDSSSLSRLYSDYSNITLYTIRYTD
ncbi:MAG: hypothetical protein ACOCWO_01870 [Candidatus Muiribacteriaceae bacterium]